MAHRNYYELLHQVLPVTVLAATVKVAFVPILGLEAAKITTVSLHHRGKDAQFYENAN